MIKGKSRVGFMTNVPIELLSLVVVVVGRTGWLNSVWEVVISIDQALLLA